MFCKHCGKEIPNHSKYCRFCSKEVFSKNYLGNPVIISHNNAKNNHGNYLYLIIFSVLAVGLFIYFSNQDQVGKNDDSDQIKQSVIVSSDEIPFEVEMAERLINKFFNLIDRREYKMAYELFSQKFQGVRSEAELKDGYKNTISHVVNDINCIDFICDIKVIATENSDENMRRVEYQFKYFFVYEDGQSLKIDRSSFVDQQVLEILKTYGADSSMDTFLFDSFVKVFCTDPSFENISQGSGTVINNDIVLTNYHINLGFPNYCFVQKLDQRGLITQDLFIVDYSIVEDSENDFWTFHIVADEKNIGLSPTILPIKNCEESRIQIGDSVRVYGFPSASGGNLTITEGLVSGIDSRVDGLYITSAKIDHGNSGGATVNTTKNCFLGVPTVGISGDLESYGGILSINKILQIQPGLFSNNNPIVEVRGRAYPGYNISYNIETYDVNVVYIQNILSEFGYTLDVDGYFGNQTLQAVKDFQAHENISSTGIVDLLTWNSLFNNIN